MDQTEAERQLAHHKHVHDGYAAVKWTAKGAEAVRELKTATEASRAILKTRPLAAMLTEGVKYKTKSGEMDVARVEFTYVELIDPTFVALSNRERKTKYRDVVEAQKVKTVLKRLNVHQRKARIKTLEEEIEDLQANHRFERGNLEAPHTTSEAREKAKQAWEKHMKEYKPQLKALRDELAEHKEKQAEAPERKVNRRKLAITRKELAEATKAQNELKNQLGQLLNAFRKFGQAGTAAKQDEERVTIETLLQKAVTIGDKPAQPDFSRTSKSGVAESSAALAAQSTSVNAAQSTSVSAAQSTSVNAAESSAAKAKSTSPSDATKPQPRPGVERHGPPPSSPTASRKRQRTASDTDSSAFKKSRASSNPPSSLSSPKQDVLDTTLLGTPAPAPAPAPTPSAYLFF